MELTDEQFSLIKEQFKTLKERSPFYAKKFEGIDLSDVQTQEDFEKLPFSEKADLREAYPLGLAAVPEEKIVRIHSSSGTTGIPVVIPYTQKDVNAWATMFSRCYETVGITNKDRIHITPGYGLWTAGIGFQLGAEKLGAMAVPLGPGNTEKQIMYMKDYGTTLLVATPSYALRIGEVATQMGLNPKTDLKLKTALVGSELLTEAMRDEMHKLYGDNLTITQNYGMSELIGPGVSGECTELCGMHINEDHFLAEIIDPETGEVLPAGEKGELVVTCLSKEALPLIRYRTRDITRLMYEPCKCGRTTARMENLSGRTDDMLKIRGVNVFPSQIEEVLLKTEEIGPHYEIIVDRKNHSDILTIRVELAPDKMTDDYAELERIRLKLKSALRVMLGLDAVIQLESPNTLKRFEGKAKRVTDNRKGQN